MNLPRLAVWIIGAAVCGAWLASAAGVTRQVRPAPPAARPADVVQLDELAADVQAQAVRLREQLARAPEPNPTPRNPFRFSAGESARRARPAAGMPSAILAETPPPPALEPALDLIGIAESSKPEGLVRTAMILGEHGDLLMVTVGGRILGRYDVVAVSAGAVDLRDAQTGAVRRLVLR